MGSLRRSLAIILAAGATLGSAATAHADDTALAQSLFDDAKRLMDAGKTDVACPKFAESLRLDPTLGTRLNLARCYELQGKMATAYAQYKEVIRTAGTDTKRAGIAKDRVVALEGGLPHATINGSVDVGAVLKLDGKPIDAAVLGTPFPIDPGAHVLEVSAPEKKTKTVEFKAEAGEPVTVSVPALEAVVHEDTGPKEPPKPTEPVPPPDEGSPGKRIGGWVSIGLGAVALGVGATFGFMTLSQASDVKTMCPTGPCPTQAGLDKNSEANTDALLADILIPVGVVAAAVGVILVVTSGGHAAPASAARVRVVPSASRAGGGLFLSGSF